MGVCPLYSPLPPTPSAAIAAAPVAASRASSVWKTATPPAWRRTWAWTSGTSLSARPTSPPTVPGCRKTDPTAPTACWTKPTAAGSIPCGPQSAGHSRSNGSIRTPPTTVPDWRNAAVHNGGSLSPKVSTIVCDSASGYTLARPNYPFTTSATAERMPLEAFSSFGVFFFDMAVPATVGAMSTRPVPR